MTPPRVASLALAALAVVVLLLDGRALLDGLDWFTRGGLALLLTGAVGALVHGVGAPNENRLLRFVARPVYAWPAVLSGAALLYVT